MVKSIYIEKYFNTTNSPQILKRLIRAQPLARILSSRFLGAASLGRGARVGPDVTAGLFFGLNDNSYAAQATIGNYCTFGARTAINPFDHPIDWLSTHEFTFHANAFNWIDAYNRFERPPWSHAPGARNRVAIGNDVWTGHNVNIMGGVSVGDGAIIGAGSIVTHDVPPYAIVGGVPAKIIRYRFAKPVIKRLLAVKWWDLPFNRLSGLPLENIELCLDRLTVIRAEEEKAR
jgi:acetyltransferase-like isoleucine patch superfamily enzyme